MVSQYVNQPLQGVVDLVRVNARCLVDIDGDLSNRAVEVCGHILSSALKDYSVSASDPTSALEHAAAHPQECIRPPLRRFEKREGKRNDSDVIKHLLLASCRTGIAGAESVLLASSPCTFRSRCVPLYSRHVDIGGNGGTTCIRSAK